MYPHFFNFRINDESGMELSILSKNLQRTKSNLLRWLIHKEFIRQGYQPLTDNRISFITDEDMDER